MFHKKKQKVNKCEAQSNKCPPNPPQKKRKREKIKTKEIAKAKEENDEKDKIYWIQYRNYEHWIEFVKVLSIKIKQITNTGNVSSGLIKSFSIFYSHFKWF